MSKIVYSAPERNKVPILEVLQQVIQNHFSSHSTISTLEVGAGTGQHGTFFCENIPNLRWHPSDIDENNLRSIKAYKNDSEAKNTIREPLKLDIGNFENSLQLLDKNYDLIVSINLVHISPWFCSVGLFKLAGILLPSGGVLMTYGPYAIHRNITPESNVRFNQSLRQQNSEWGLRDIDDLEKEAKDNEIFLHAVYDMPANNKTIVWIKN